ncbi:hypothetical protein MesoLjLc_18630 [Mesorhizobium sp. L-8-10]|nr:hypothetical protein MesoLjLc_18630 [Mesorhizobium sp. L-8-10]
MQETTGHRRTGGMLARILLALAFLTMSALQPGPYGAPENSPLRDRNAIAADALQVAPVPEPASIDAGGQHAGVSAKSGKVADQNCQVHCAPTAALLVGYLTIQPQIGGCPAPPPTPQLPSAEHASPIRPPRLVA